MAAQRGSKLNRLQHLLPEGLLVDAPWMERHGYSRALRSQYVAAGWLEQPARGVYRRPGGKLRWQQAVVSLQTLLNVPIIVGGRTALEMQGFAHYVSPTDAREVHLHGPCPLPGWARKLDLEVRFVFHSTQRLFREGSAAADVKDAARHLDGSTDTGGKAVPGGLVRLAWGHWDWPLTVSTPERAILEVLDELPHRETFHQADMLMEGLQTLSPRRLQALLEDCRSVKVKRLFLWFAERQGFPWLKHLDLERIDLGSGKRMLVRDGRLDPKYLITVPGDRHGVQ